MERIVSFHKTAHGYGHIQHNQPCEDASASWQDEAGRFFVAVVADGHGQDRSFRSGTGASCAAEITLNFLKETAAAAMETPEDEEAFYASLLESDTGRLETIQCMTDSILARWHDEIRGDFLQNPPTEEEFGEFADYYSDPEKIAEIYGTTLLAALWMPRCLLLLHQGDGRCDVFYEDGTVDQPIPWDDRCVGNVCTSLCEESARESFRHCVIDFEKKQVAACYLGTDGVDDAYRDQMGTHLFYKDLSAELVDREQTQIDEYLTQLLPEFSATGRFSSGASQDDVSVAGIMDRERLQPLVSRFRYDVQRFVLEEQLFYAQTRLGSMTRKHGILDKRRMEAREKVRAYQSEEKQLGHQKNDLLKLQKELETAINRNEEQLKEADWEYEQLCQELREQPDEEQKLFFGKFQKTGLLFRVLKKTEKNLENSIRRARAQQNQLHGRKAELEEKIREQETQISKLRDVIQLQQEAAEQEEAVYLEYNREYLAIQNEIQELQQQLSALKTEQPDLEEPQQ